MYIQYIDMYSLNLDTKTAIVAIGDRRLFQIRIKIGLKLVKRFSIPSTSHHSVGLPVVLSQTALDDKRFLQATFGHPDWYALALMIRRRT